MLLQLLINSVCELVRGQWAWQGEASLLTPQSLEGRSEHFQVSWTVPIAQSLLSCGM